MRYKERILCVQSSPESKAASVTIDGEVVGSIPQGFLILLGVTHEDTEAQVVKLADKICSLRVFEDENGKLNRGLDEVEGQLLIVSQFTLYGSCKKGRRPTSWPPPAGGGHSPV